MQCREHMEYSDYQYPTEGSGCVVAMQPGFAPSAHGNADDAAQVSAPEFIVMDDAALWEKPVVNFKGIVTGLIISAVFWILKILLLIKIFTS